MRGSVKTSDAPMAGRYCVEQAKVNPAVFTVSRESAARFERENEVTWTAALSKILNLLKGSYCPLAWRGQAR